MLILNGNYFKIARIAKQVFYNINNNDVIQWSKKLNRLGVESYVYVNTGASHGGFDSNDTELLAYFLNYFLEQIEK